MAAVSIQVVYDGLRGGKRASHLRQHHQQARGRKTGRHGEGVVCWKPVEALQLDSDRTLAGATTLKWLRGTAYCTWVVTMDALVAACLCPCALMVEGVPPPTSINHLSLGTVMLKVVDGVRFVAEASWGRGLLVVEPGHEVLWKLVGNG